MIPWMNAQRCLCGVPTLATDGVCADCKAQTSPKYERWMAEFKAKDARREFRAWLAKRLEEYGLWNKAGA